MSDSLDDFFAKKDKKRKNKSQTTAISAVSLVRELEEGSTKQNDYSARREGKTSAAIDLLGLDSNDNDWKDFEEVERRDYTGLKVKEMSIQDQEEEQRRLNDHADQVPESIPWKSKQETVAAIISAKDEHNHLTSDQLETTDTTDATANIPTATTKPSTDNTESDGSKIGSTQSLKSGEADAKGLDTTDAPKTEDNPETADKKPEAGEKNPGAEGEKPKTEVGSEDASKKDGDSKPVTVKKVYVPPHERLERENKVLEPIKLSKLRGSSSRPGASINIKDEKMFPSLG